MKPLDRDAILKRLNEAIDDGAALPRDPEARRLVEADPQWRREWEELRAIEVASRSSARPLPRPELRARILEALEGEPLPSAGGAVVVPTTKFRWWAAGVAAALVAVAATSVLLEKQRGHEDPAAPPPPVAGIPSLPSLADIDPSLTLGSRAFSLAGAEIAATAQSVNRQAGGALRAFTGGRWESQSPAESTGP